MFQEVESNLYGVKIDNDFLVCKQEWAHYRLDSISGNIGVLRDVCGFGS